jgi:ubiquinone/menaquinone biosynthesis methyltransferase
MPLGKASQHPQLDAARPARHLSAVTNPERTARTSDVPSARELNALDLRATVADPERKQAFVTPMFEHIAPKYDAFTRLFSFGMDARWKRQLLSWVAEHHAPDASLSILDVACGTGDLALACARRLPHARVHGLDAAGGMVARAKARAAREALGADFRVGDLASTPWESGSMDVVTAGYAFRNVSDLRLSLAEMARVLRPRGRLYVLDFYRPRHRIWRALFLRYLSVAGSLVGWWWHRSPAIYAYIAVSIEQFVTGEQFAAALSSVGLEPLRSRSYLGGAIMLHEAERGARGRGSG